MIENGQEFSLRWNNHEHNLCRVLESMLKREVLVDVTLFSEGKSHRVHRAVLSACSPYFEELFIENVTAHPIIILKDVKAEELKSLIDYMYTGQVTVSQSELSGFLKTAESLKIRGLAYAIPNAATDTGGENSEGCDPPGPRKRKLSSKTGDGELKTDDFSYQGPTDLSIPKSDIPELLPVVPIRQESCLVNLSKPSIFVKPRETMMTPPVVDLNKAAENIVERNGYSSFRMDGVFAQPEMPELLVNPCGLKEEARSEKLEPKMNQHFSNLSDDEEVEHNIGEISDNFDGNRSFPYFFILFF